MATMDQSSDAPDGTTGDDTAGENSQQTGGATAFEVLFSHEETPQQTTPVTTATAKQASAEQTAAGQATQAAPTKPTKATARKTTGTKTTARSAARAQAAHEAVETLLDEEAAQEAAAIQDTPAGQPASELGTGAAADSGAGSPFGMLFQAPDLSAVPARPTRRRSTGSGTGTAGPEDPETEGHQGSQRGRRSGRTSQDAGQDSSAGGTDRGTEQAQNGPDQDTRGDGQDDSPDDGEGTSSRRRRRRGGKGRRGRGNEGDDSGSDTHQGSDNGSGNGDGGSDDADGSEADSSTGTVRRRRRSNRRGEDGEARESRRAREEVTGVRGSTRLEAKRQRRREGREAGRRRTIITEAEFLARRESVERTMVVRGQDDRTQIGVLEDGVLVEHYVSRATQSTMVGNVYLGRVQNVLPSMEAAFVDIGKGRNAVLYAGEVNWDAAGLDSNQPKRIENALKSGDSVLVQVTKDPIGHKGARLTSQVSLPGRYLVLVPGNSMTGISRKLPDTERARLKKILKEVVPEGAGVIVRTAAEGASEQELRADVERLTGMWDRITGKQQSANAPSLLHGEPDMTVRVIRDVFNEDFAKVVVAGERAWTEVSDYLNDVAPDLADRLEKWTGSQDVFTHYRVTEALAKAMDRKVWLPSGGSLVIDRTEAMTVVDVNTGKFVGSGGNLEETVTKNNIEAAEEIVRQLRLRDIGGIIVIDFIDMVLESNRDLVVRRLLECLGRDRTKHQVAEVTSLGLVQMTRKRVGAGLIEVFSEPCTHCSGRGIVVHAEPIDKSEGNGHHGGSGNGGRRGRGRSGQGADSGTGTAERPTPAPGGPTPAQIAAAAHAAAIAGSTQTAAGTPGETAKETSVSRAAGASTTEPVTEPATPHTSTPTVDQGSGGQETPPATPSTPTPRPRRRRGRVVAPAGPPAGADHDPASGAEPDAASGAAPASVTPGTDASF